MDYVAKKLVKELPHLNVCWDENAVLRFAYAKNRKPTADATTFGFKCAEPWVTYEEFIKNSSSEAFIDEIIYKKLTLVTDTPESKFCIMRDDPLRQDAFSKFPSFISRLS